ncbi:MAG: 16S rRNA (uracil(1498)-N(3))-methyltransferase, partial [Cyanobium sp.]
MNIILLRPDDWLENDVVVLRDRRADHIRTVLHAQPGDCIRVGLLAGLIGDGRVEALADDGVRLRVQLADAAPPRHRFDLVLALPRPKMLRRILRTVAEFGVQHLHLLQSARVEKSYWQSPLLRPEKLESALHAGLERSRDTLAPRVHLHRRFRPFVEDQLPGLCDGRPCWLADVGGPVSLAAVPPVPAVVMIGPEGGFVPFEHSLAERAGARPVHLGARTFSV